MKMRASQTDPRSLFLAALAITSIAACSQEAQDEPREILTQDPQLARALDDPLMVDPDLSWRNEASSVVAIRNGHPLPALGVRDDLVSRARETARLELLDDGPIPSLPAFAAGDAGISLAAATTADEMVEAVGARVDCVGRLTSDLDWSTRMPPTSSIMPHGMVQQAAGADVGTCVIRVVRYIVPVGIEDALEYHFAKADRARFDVSLINTPEAQMIAERRDQKLVVHARGAPGGMTAVDVVYWRK